MSSMRFKQAMKCHSSLRIYKIYKRIMFCVYNILHMHYHMPTNTQTVNESWTNCKNPCQLHEAKMLYTIILHFLPTIDLGIISIFQSMYLHSGLWQAVQMSTRATKQHSHLPRKKKYNTIAVLHLTPQIYIIKAKLR